MGAIDTCLALLVLAGCETSEPFSFKPSNGLDPAMTAAAGEPDAVLPAVTVNTDDCSMHDVANQQIVLASMAVAQDNAPGICAFIAGSFDLGDVTVTGSRALAFVTPGSITLRGHIDASAHAIGRGTIIGPGASGDCVGDIADVTNVKDGGGGGGNATAGGDGLFFSLPPTHRAGGAAQHGFEPLVGGCAGGGSSGGGGGAVQLDSEQEIRLLGSSFLALGGAAGAPGAGGSSGGNALFEAPRISIVGGVAANGGGGGANGDTCPTAGEDAHDDEAPAAGGVASCQASPTRGGAGGTATVAPGVGTVFGFGAGGGGAVGRIGLRTADGNFEGPGAIFSVVETTETLATR